MFPRFENLEPHAVDSLTALLTDRGWEDAGRCAQTLQELREYWRAVQGDSQDTPDWYEILARLLQTAMNPAATLDAVRDLIRASPSPQHAFDLFSQAPRSLEILSRFAGSSPFLTHVLVSDPDALPFLSVHRRVSELKSDRQFTDEAAAFIAQSPEPPLTALRQYQRREQLRIGMCDVFGLFSLQHVTLQLSLLADAMVRTCLELAETETTRAPFAVLALGKLGGEELNYSSDIDLVLVADHCDSQGLTAARRMIDSLSEHSGGGFLYRVDLRLRPWGSAGPLVTTPDAWTEYLAGPAQLWEKQALLKARCIAGKIETGRRFLSRLPEVLFTESKQTIRDSIRRMKDVIEANLVRTGRQDREVKLGIGSIRDIEFLTQSLQLMHCGHEPRLASANTLHALLRLADFGLLDAATYQQLREGYVFLRAVEHALQLQHNRQTHEVPRDARLQRWLALRLDYPDEATFMNRFEEHRRTVRRIFERHFGSHASAGAAVARTDAGWEPPGAAGPDAGGQKTDSRFGPELQRLLKDAAESKRVQAELLPVSEDRGVLLLAAEDRPELLTLISGRLFALGVDIRDGRVSTGPGAADETDVPSGMFVCRMTVESQTDGRLPDALAARLCDGIQQSLKTMRTDGPDVVREQLIDGFCERMQRQDGSRRGSGRLRLTDRVSPDRKATIVSIHVTDSPGFLFELSNALNVCGFRIRQAQIEVHDGCVEDELFVTESDRQEPLRPERIRDVHTAVALIQQFTLWLPDSADPAAALLRFRRLLQAVLNDVRHDERARTLRDPDVLQRAARVLGLSRHLWEDALRLQESAMTLLSDPEPLRTAVTQDILRHQARQILREQPAAGDPGGADATVRLNRFKDEHLFRIELRHVLGHSREFGVFSREICELVEVVLETAAQLAWQELAVQSGQDVPRVPWTLAGLGKLGGREMGYGSDVEVLLIYDGDGDRKTARWFDRLLHRTVDRISSRHDGIFHVDLRMRPWGQAGTAAVSLSQFRTYYGAGGTAWAFERQSMIRLRPFGSDESFAQRVRRVRDEVIFDGRPFDFVAMQGLREEQIRQHVVPGTVNVKLSQGGLVDLEYSVQAVQLTFGHRFAELRTTGTATALEAAFDLGLLPQNMRRPAQQACWYLRRVIDGLRMVRGNARDLTMPPADSAEGIQLGRRLEQLYGPDTSPADLSRHRDTVSRLAEIVTELCGRPSENP